jgi:hypothetical protein
MLSAATTGQTCFIALILMSSPKSLQREPNGRIRGMSALALKEDIDTISGGLAARRHSLP